MHRSFHYAISLLVIAALHLGGNVSYAEAEVRPEVIVALQAFIDNYASTPSIDAASYICRKAPSGNKALGKQNNETSTLGFLPMPKSYALDVSRIGQESFVGSADTRAVYPADTIAVCSADSIALAEAKRALDAELKSAIRSVAIRWAEPIPKSLCNGLIFISKQCMTLTLFDAAGEEVMTLPIACGKSYGNKRKSGDMRTPEGVFKVQQILESSHWTHDFHDGHGVIKGAYGPYFIRLNTAGFKGIGIHGTHDPTSIGTRATEGCIRLNNEQLCSLIPYITPEMPVLIGSSAQDYVCQ